MNAADAFSEGLRAGLGDSPSRVGDAARRLAPRAVSEHLAVTETQLVILTPLHIDWLGENVMSADQARADSLERMQRKVAKDRPSAVLIESTFRLHVLLRSETDAAGLKAVECLGLPSVLADESSVENVFPSSVMGVESLTLLLGVATVREVRS